MTLGDAFTSGFRPTLLLTLLCAFLFLPGIAGIPPTDRDEARFMQATKQMVESGDWVHIRFQSEPRNKKPVGIYWLQALSVRAMGQEHTVTWPYRLPSVLAAWMAVLVTFQAGRRLFSPAAGLAAGAVLATSLIVVAEAHIAKTDATLLGTTTLALTMLARLYTAPRATTSPAIYGLLFWMALGLGILIKGPVIVLVAGLTIAALCIADRDAGWLKALRAGLGIPLMLIIVLPWLIAVSGNAQGSFIADSLRQDLLPKLIGGQESHGAPPGTYLLATLLTAWPWSALAPFVMAAAWTQRATPAVRFCLAWLIPSWIVFEIVPTKLPHYTLPLLPALALLTAWALSQAAGARNFPRWVGGGLGVAYRIVWAAITFGLGAGVAVAHSMFGDGAPAGAVAAVAITIAAGVFVLVGFARVTAPTALLGLTAAGIFFSLTLTSGVLPHLKQLAISPRLAAIIAQHPPPTPVALAGFHEPSAVFLLGTATLLTDTAGAITHLRATPGALAVVPLDALETVRAALAPEGRSVSLVDEVDGYNYARGDRLRLAVISAPAGKPPSGEPP